nr:hypothetical protein [Vibrio vulnificus]
MAFLVCIGFGGYGTMR